MTAIVTDAAGNDSDLSNIANFTFDDGVDPIGAPVITINEALPDGIVDVDEKADGVQTQVTVPAGADVGDTIVLTLTQPNGSVIEVNQVIPLIGMELQQ